MLGALEASEARLAELETGHRAATDRHEVELAALAEEVATVLQAALVGIAQRDQALAVARHEAELGVDPLRLAEMEAAVARSRGEAQAVEAEALRGEARAAQDAVEVLRGRVSELQSALEERTRAQAAAEAAAEAAREEARGETRGEREAREAARALEERLRSTEAGGREAVREAEVRLRRVEGEAREARAACEDLRLQLTRLEADKRGLQMQAEALEQAHAADVERTQQLQRDLQEASAGQRSLVQDAGDLRVQAEREAAELRAELRAAHLEAEEAERRAAGERKLANARAQQGLEKLEQQISALEGQVSLEKQNQAFLEKSHQQKVAFLESTHEAALAAIQGKMDAAEVARSAAEERQAGFTSDAARLHEEVEELQREARKREEYLEATLQLQKGLEESQALREGELAEALRDVNALEKEKAALEGRGEALEAKLVAAVEEATKARAEVEGMAELVAVREGETRQEAAEREARLKEEVERLRGELRDRDDSLGALRETQMEMENDLQALSDSNMDLVSKQDALSKELEEEQNRRAEEAQTGSLSAQELETKVLELAAAENRCAVLEEQAAEAAADAEMRHAKAFKEFEDFAAERQAGLEAAESAAREEKAGLAASLEQAQMAAAAEADKAEQLEAELAESKAEASLLRQERDASAVQVSALTARLHGDGENPGLTAELESAQERAAAEETRHTLDIEALTRERDSLQAERDDIEAKNAVLEAERDTIAAEAASLRSEADVQAAEVVTLRARIEGGDDAEEPGLAEEVARVRKDLVDLTLKHTQEVATLKEESARELEKSARELEAEREEREREREARAAEAQEREAREVEVAKGHAAELQEQFDLADGQRKDLLKLNQEIESLKAYVEELEEEPGLAVELESLRAADSERAEEVANLQVDLKQKEAHLEAEMEKTEALAQEADGLREELQKSAEEANEEIGTLRSKALELEERISSASVDSGEMARLQERVLELEVTAKETEELRARVEELEEENELMDQELQVAAGEIQKQVSFSQAQAGAVSSTVHVMRARAEAAEKALRANQVDQAVNSRAESVAAGGDSHSTSLESRPDLATRSGGKRLQKSGPRPTTANKPSTLGAVAPASPARQDPMGSNAAVPVSPMSTRLQESLAQRSLNVAPSTPGSSDRWAALRASIAHSQQSGGRSTDSFTPRPEGLREVPTARAGDAVASLGRDRGLLTVPAPSPADSPAGSVGSVSSQATKERWLRAKNKAVTAHSEDLAARLERMKSVRESVLVKMAGISPKLVTMASPADGPGHSGAGH